jgi:hypothetical protein
LAEHHNDAFAVLAGGLTGDGTFHLRDVPGAEPHLVVACRLCDGRAACEGEKKSGPGKGRGKVFATHAADPALLN